eukprot:scaffold297839_cov24-Prasinocladus_malaysianus.AAC.2
MIYHSNPKGRFATIIGSKYANVWTAPKPINTARLQWTFSPSSSVSGQQMKPMVTTLEIPRPLHPCFPLI